jgi:pSer/pThr/pTyr-binding forkhead associated (FHA) protein
MSVRLSMLRGEWAGETVDIPEGKFLIGREVDCHLQSQSPFVSRHHCVLLRDEFAIRVRDLGSKNGTYVNGERIGSGEPVLSSGDVVSAGEIEFQVIFDQTSEVEPQVSTRSAPAASALAGSTLLPPDGDAQAPSQSPNRVLVGHLD